jgi:hypothetical protein
MGVRRGVYRILVGNMRKRDHLEEPGIDGKIILSWIFRMWDGMGGHGLDYVVQDRDRWQTLVNVGRMQL